eukprot:scaffold106583_cov30-Phaeocystis_antarctica.AAC.1
MSTYLVARDATTLSQPPARTRNCPQPELPAPRTARTRKCTLPSAAPQYFCPMLPLPQPSHRA